MRKSMYYECILCNLQYVGKSETSFNIRLNNHRKDVSNPTAIPACAHFRKEGHKFKSNMHKFTLIEQLTETKRFSKATLKLRLKHRENFSVLKLNTLSSKRINYKLNND